MTKEIITATGKYWIDEKTGIAWKDHNPGTYSTLETARADLAALKALCDGKRYPLLCDLRNLKGTDRDARQYFAGGEAAEVYSALALVGGTPMSNIIGNVFLAISGTKTPAKLFSDQESAIEWLKGFIR
ncbi:MAG TPA: hypothetical protein VM580_13725 [Labilithrix sp.]|nr:hypothetical protein [Labilithrix sp.]